MSSDYLKLSYAWRVGLEGSGEQPSPVGVHMWTVCDDSRAGDLVKSERARSIGKKFGARIEAARTIVIETVRKLEHQEQQEAVPLEMAHGRVLAENVTADRDYPALRRSLRDGFAVQSSGVPGTLHVRGEVRAGQGSQDRLNAGEALEIMTGAPVPEDADAVVMVEHVERAGTQLRIDRAAEAGQFINEQGAEARQGSILITKGTPLDASHIATLAMVGRTSITVFGRPKVAILSTGDEIVELNETPEPHQVRNSNAYMLASLVLAAGGQPTVLPIARDTVSGLRRCSKKD